MIPGPAIRTFRDHTFDRTDGIPRIGPVAWLRGKVRFPRTWAAFVDCPTSGCGHGIYYGNDTHDWEQTTLPIGDWSWGESGRDTECDRCGWRGMVTRPPVPVVWWYDATVRTVVRRRWPAVADRLTRPSQRCPF